MLFYNTAKTHRTRVFQAVRSTNTNGKRKNDAVLVFLVPLSMLAAIVFYLGIFRRRGGGRRQSHGHHATVLPRAPRKMNDQNQCRHDESQQAAALMDHGSRISYYGTWSDYKNERI